MDEALEDLQDFEDLPLEIKTKMQGANPEQV